MVPDTALTNAIRGQRYRFKRQTDRVRVYKKQGDTSTVHVRKNATHSEEYARSILQSAGMPDGEIRKFLAQVSMRH